MKTTTGVLLALILLASVHALYAADDNADVPVIDTNALTSSFRLLNESVAASPAKITPERWIFLLYVNGTPVAMADVRQNGGQWQANVIQTQTELASAVRLYHASIGNLGMARKELEAAQILVLEYNTSRTRERDCLDALGLALRPCKDYDSCLKSCFMSVEFCQPLAQANGKEFINEISDYQNKSMALTQAIAKTTQVYEMAWAQVGSATLANYNSTLPAIWSDSAVMLSQPLSGPLCQKPFYDSATNPKIQAHLAKALDWIEPVEDGTKEAQSLMEEMGRRKVLKAAETAQKNSLSNVLGLGSDFVFPNSDVAILAVAGFCVAIGLIGFFVWKRNNKPKAEKPQTKG